MKKRDNLLVAFLVFFVFLVSVASAATKQEEWRKVKRLEKALRDRAEVFNVAYVEQNFKGMYKLVEPSYKVKVSLREYQDYVFYFNTTNAYMTAEILDVIVMPDRKHGKVLKKRSTYEIHGDVRKKGAVYKMSEKDMKRKPIREYIYGEDWLVVDNVWYRMESKN